MNSHYFQIDEILNQFKNVADGQIDDYLFMKLAVVKNVCPDLDIDIGTDRFNPILELNSHELEKNLTQPCSDLIYQCQLNEVKLNCSRIFSSFITDLGHCCSFNLLPEVLHWDLTKKAEQGGKIF